MRSRSLLAVLALAVASACGTERKLSADEYYKQASTAFEGKNYEVAVKSYKELLDQYPFNDHAEEAELRIAQSHYKNKKYAEAIAAFNDFQRMHPMSPHLPEVYYLLGKSYMDQMGTTDRDQAASENAHGWFRVVMDRYPESPYAAKAHRKLTKCRHDLAEHELYIATYYFKRDNLRAGENRVKGILENYPDTAVATRALDELAAAYTKEGDAAHEQMVRAALAERGATGATGEPPADPDDKDGDATPGGEAPVGAVPARTDARPSVDPRATRGPATAALLADLTVRFGPAQGLSTAATTPTLLDPTVPAKGPRGDAGPGRIPGAEPPGGY